MFAEIRNVIEFNCLWSHCLLRNDPLYLGELSVAIKSY